MFELSPEKFYTVHEWAKKSQVEKVYPCSITEGRQSGRIFVDNRQEVHTVLFWHHCGFAYLVGRPDKVFLQEISRLLRGNFAPDQQRFILHVKDKVLEAELDKIDHVLKNTRYNFVWQAKKAVKKLKPLPSDYQLEALNAENMKQLSGRIIPSFSWKDQVTFLEKGKGYGICAKGKIIASAFSAAIGNGELDIGLETDEAYRGRGLGARTAFAMLQYCKKEGLTPVWGCAIQNEGSRRTAESVGFILSDQHAVYYKA